MLAGSTERLSVRVIHQPVIGIGRERLFSRSDLPARQTCQSRNSAPGRGQEVGTAGALDPSMFRGLTSEPDACQLTRKS